MKNIAALAVLIGSCLPANAEVSDDLKFCGSLKSGAERLACYDAAARIASRTAPARPPMRSAPADAQAAAILVKAPPLPARNAFEGYYAAIGGGYGIVSGRDNGVFGSLTGSVVPVTSISGPNVTGVLGRNVAFGWGLVGLELDARWSKEQGSRATTIVDQFPNAGTAQYGYRYTDDAGLHALIRVGATFDDLLIFARAGIGASRISESFTADERNLRPCSFSFTGCTPGPAGDLGAVSITSWVPSAVLGLGAEQNWGSVYARLGADLEAFNHAATSASAAKVTGTSSASQIMWTTRGTAMIGVRF